MTRAGKQQHISEVTKNIKLPKKPTKKKVVSKKKSPAKKQRGASTLILKQNILQKVNPFKEMIAEYVSSIGKVGREPTVTPHVVAKLEEAFSYDMTVKEACVHSGISRDAYYRFTKEHPDFRNRFEDLREMPVLAMRKVVIQEAMNNPEMAFKYLGVKKKGEFSQRIESINTNINTDTHVVDERTEKLIKTSLGGFGKKLVEMAQKNQAKAEKKR